MSGEAVVTLVEYGNYECLHCRRAHPFVEALRDEVGDRLRFVYRHFARPADFPNAELAAEAAEAAGAQGRFWEMHDALFTGEPRLHRAALADHAAALGLDMVAFDEALRDRRYRDDVRAQLADGLALGVRSTPTFFIDGVLHEDAWDLESLREAVLEAASGQRPAARGEVSGQGRAVRGQGTASAAGALPLPLTRFLGSS